MKEGKIDLDSRNIAFELYFNDSSDSVQLEDWQNETKEAKEKRVYDIVTTIRRWNKFRVDALCKPQVEIIISATPLQDRPGYQGSLKNPETIKGKFFETLRFPDFTFTLRKIGKGRANRLMALSEDRKKSSQDQSDTKIDFHLVDPLENKRFSSLEKDEDDSSEPDTKTKRTNNPAVQRERMQRLEKEVDRVTNLLQIQTEEIKHLKDVQTALEETRKEMQDLNRVQSEEINELKVLCEENKHLQSQLSMVLNYFQTNFTQFNDTKTYQTSTAIPELRQPIIEMHARQSETGPEQEVRSEVIKSPIKAKKKDLSHLTSPFSIQEDAQFDKLPQKVRAAQERRKESPSSSVMRDDISYCESQEIESMPKMTTADLRLLGKKEKKLYCQQTARQLLLQGKSVAETLEILKARDLWNSSFDKVSQILKIMSKKGLIAKDAILDVNFIKAESIGEFLSDNSFLFDQKENELASENKLKTSTSGLEAAYAKKYKSPQLANIGQNIRSNDTVHSNSSSACTSNVTYFNS